MIKAKQTDCQSNGFISLSEESGYISISSEDGIIGTTSCPWRIKLAPGRRVNITMMNFPPIPTLDTSSPSSACYEVGSIKESGKIKTIHKCINDARQKQLYLSNGGQMEIIISNKETLDVAGRFLMHYQGNVTF